MGYPKYIVRKSTDNKFFWVLKAINAETLLTSETFITKQGCLNGINSSKRCVQDKNFDKRMSTNMQYYFNQVADNYEILGKSETYVSSYNRDNGIAAVKRDAPRAEIEDLT